jgi:hypothetical protein
MYLHCGTLGRFLRQKLNQDEMPTERARVPPNTVAAEAAADSTDLRCAIQQTLPLASADCLEQAVEGIRRVLAEYASLKAANAAQLTARQARKSLKRGAKLLRELEQWMLDVEPTVVRDYLLSLNRSPPRKQRRSDMLRPVWKEMLSEIRLWQKRFAQSLVFIPSDRGKPENFPLKQLVRDLAKIWEKYTVRPFTNSKKRGLQQPRDFTIAVCGAIEPDLSKSEIETAIRYAVSKMPGNRRGRKSQPQSAN